MGADGVADGHRARPRAGGAVARRGARRGAPGRSALGHQIAAGPCSGRVAVVAGLIVPAAVGSVAVLPSLLAACVALARELPGGPVAGLALAAAIVAAVPAGAVVAEGGVAAARGQRRRPLAIAAERSHGLRRRRPRVRRPPGPLARSQRRFAARVRPGSRSLSLPAWPLCSRSRGSRLPPPGGAAGSEPGRVGRFVRAGRLPVPTALAVLLARRSEVRLATAGAVGFGAAGIAIATAAARLAHRLPARDDDGAARVDPVPARRRRASPRRRLALEGGPADGRVICGAAGLVGLVASALPVALVGALRPSSRVSPGARSGS